VKRLLECFTAGEDHIENARVVTACAYAKATAAAVVAKVAVVTWVRISVPMKALRGASFNLFNEFQYL